MPRITDYDLYEVPPRWLFLRVETSDGRVGWGEPVVEGRAHTVRGAVEELMETYLLGEDPHPVSDHWQAMYRGGFYRGGPVLMSAIAGIDQALWDLRGKAFDAPVYDLLGGPVRFGLQQVRKTPKTTPHQTVLHWRTEITGGHKELVFEDHHNNTTELIGLDRDTQSLDVLSEGEIEVSDTHGIVGAHRGPAPLWLYARITPRTEARDHVRALLRGLPAEGDLDRLGGLFEVFDARRADDGGGHPVLVKQPGER